MLKHTSGNFNAHVISLFFIGMMFFLPFIVMSHHIPIPSFYGEWVTGLLGVLGCLIMASESFWREIKIPRISLVFIGLAIILALQWVLGMLHSLQYALLAFSYLIWACLITMLGSYLRNTLGWEKMSIILATFILIGGMANVCIIAIQIAIKSGIDIPFIPNLTNYGALAQENNLADYICLAIASLMYLYAKLRIEIKKFTVCLVLLLIALTFSGSRSSFVYIGMLAIFSAVLHMTSNKLQTNVLQIRKNFIISLWLLPIFIALQLLLNQLLPDSLLNLPTDQLINGLKSRHSSLRLGIWYDSWRLGVNSPLLGIGIGQMRWQSFLLLGTPTAYSSNVICEHAHNLFLHLFTEMGIFAAILAVAGILSWLFNFKWRNLNLESWWILAVLGIISFHSMLEYPLWYAYFLGIAAFLLGAGEEKIYVLQIPDSKALKFKLSYIIFSLIFTLNLLTLYIANVKIESWLLYAQTKNLTPTDQKQFTKDLIWVSNNSLFQPYGELTLALTTNINKGDPKSKLWIIDSSMRLLPIRQIAYKRVALLNAIGDKDGAENALKLIQLAFPVQK